MLEQDGWVQVATKGSHLQFKHPTKRGRETVPHPNKDVPRGTVASTIATQCYTGGCAVA